MKTKRGLARPVVNATKPSAISNHRRHRPKTAATPASRPSPITLECVYWHIERHENLFRISFPAVSGRTVKKAVRWAEIHGSVDFRKTLVEADFPFPVERDEAARLHGALLRDCRRMALDRKRERRLTSEPGWHDDGACFVLPGRVFPRGAPLAFDRDRKRHYASVHAAGSFEGWLEEVARPAAASSRFMVAIMAALAAPLLRWRGGAPAGGFGFCFSGASRQGKTTALRLAKSVISGPTPDGWGVSRAGGIAVLRGHTDLPLFLDEAAAVCGGRARGGAIVSELTDKLSSGRPDILHPEWSPEEQAGEVYFRSILLATAEGGLDPSRRPGEGVRLIELPAARPGSFGVVDHPGRARPPVGDALGAAQLAEELERAAFRNCGHALPRFIGRLVLHRAELVGWVKRSTDDFHRLVGAAKDGRSRSVAASFGLVYAAGMLAKRFGVVPWPEAAIGGAVVRCCRDALSAAASPEARAADAMERIRRWIGDAKRAAVVGEGFQPEHVERYDVIHDRDRGERVALVQRERLFRVAGGEAELAAALDYAKRNGWLVPNHETGAVTRQKRFPGTWIKPRFVFFRASFLEKDGQNED